MLRQLDHQNPPARVFLITPEKEIPMLPERGLQEPHNAGFINILSASP